MTSPHGLPSTAPGRALVVGRYELLSVIARGGMASVHLARLVGDEGFSRLVAAKRLHPQFAEDRDFVEMFLDEARIASRVRHPNVVPVLDVVRTDAEVVLVEEYVHGVPLNWLARNARTSRERIPLPIVSAIMMGLLEGLHAAHTTIDETGQALHIVHRDVSPHNVIVGADGRPQLVDFGIAKSRSNAHVTQAGFLKGKFGYMAPEQIRFERLGPPTDVFATGIVLWELVANRRLHRKGTGEAEIVTQVLQGTLPSIAASAQREQFTDATWQQVLALDEIFLRATLPDKERRFQSAAEMADALRLVVPPATAREVQQWVREVGATFLADRDKLIAHPQPASMPPLSTTGSGSGSSSSRVTAALGAAEGHPPAPPPIVLDGQPTLPDLGPRNVPSMPVPGAAQHGAPPPSGLGVRGLVALCVAVACVTAAGVLLFRCSNRDAGHEGSVGPSSTTAATGADAESAIVLGAPNAATTTTAAAVSAVQNAPAAPSASAQASSPPASASALGGHAQTPRPPQPVVAKPPVVAPRPVPTPAPVTPHATGTATSTAAPKDDCNPPFYFEGTKKIFKPGCI